MFKKRIKIPKKLRRLKAEGIEVRMPVTPEDVAAKIPPFYVIRSISRDGGYDNLGYVDLEIYREERGKEKYFITKVFPVGEKKSVIGQENNKGDANSLAHETAVAIASRIAEYNDLPFEDLTEADISDLRERVGGESQLEGKLPVFLLFIIGGAVLSLSSLTITGNTISNLSGTTPGLLGIILFIAGLTGMFSYFRRK